MTIKPFDDLDITDPIMFGLVFSNTHIAKPTKREKPSVPSIWKCSSVQNECREIMLA